MNADGPITLMVIDEHPDVCKRLAQAVGALPDVKLIEATTNVVLGAEVAHQTNPDVILTDFSWGGVGRAEKLRWIARMSPSSQLLVYSSFYREGEREGFAEAGAARCLLKGPPLKELAGQIRSAATARSTAHAKPH